MRPGEFFKKWYFHPNTFSGVRVGLWEDDRMRAAFEKGREYEKKYGKDKKVRRSRPVGGWDGYEDLPH